MSVDIVEAPLPGEISDRLETFLEALSGPTLFHVPGRDRSRTRVIAGLLHGNEPSGGRAIHRALAEGVEPQTDVLFFLGGVEAARAEPRFSLRALPGRRDPNRCYRPPWEGVDGRIAREVREMIMAWPGQLECAVDLHNNTGRNPAYAISSNLGGPHLALSDLFASRIILSRLALGTFSEAMEHLCPSVTIECGQAHDPEADATAWHGLLRLLKLERLDPVIVRPERLEVYVAPIRVELAGGTSIAFDQTPNPAVDVTVDADIDRLNFKTLAVGTRIGFVRPGADWPFKALDEAGEERAHELFDIEASGELVARQSFVPIMMTLNADIARSDCLFYAVHRWQ